LRSSAHIEALTRPPLPIEAVLPRLKQVLAESANAVLVAPPGAGKTSAVAPALLDAAWLQGRRILLMLPRRLAARAAAERIAGLLGEPVGKRVGYRTRLDTRVGPDCRIECLTEGIFTNLILREPGLPEIGALLFDEVHERNLEGDLGLALALDMQALRPDIRILAMSATLDGNRYATLLGDAPVVESPGQSFPIEIRHVGRSGDQRIEAAMARTILAGLRSEAGSMLAFLPGVAEIERTAAELVLPPDVALHKLYGGADPAAQRAALAAGETRKLVLATSIAETSLTIDGVRLVVDSGLARRPRFDRASGLTRLVTERASQAAATQRAGRAGRQGPGIVWRLWDEAETAGRIPFDPPEILDTDLAALLLTLAAWGARDPAQLSWMDPPPPAAVEAARAQLLALDALSSDGRITARGEALAGLPLPPRLAHMLLESAAGGAARLGATIALLLQERGLGGPSTDLDTRLARFSEERGPRTEAARSLAARWAAAAERQSDAGSGPTDSAQLLAAAFPDRVARRRRAAAAADRTVAYLMANGRGVLVDALDPLAQAEWLVVADAGGAGADQRVRLAAVLGADALAGWLCRKATVETQTGIDPASGRVVAERVERLGAITVSRRRLERPEAALIAEALIGEVVRQGLDALPWGASERAMRARIAFAAQNGLSGLPDMSDAGLLATLSDWLSARLSGVDRLADIPLDGALMGLLDWQTACALDAFAPARFEAPAGTSHAIDYLADGGPVVEVRAQALFPSRAAWPRSATAGSSGSTWNPSSPKMSGNP
jgi:ATP-dependent helicase HrpB